MIIKVAAIISLVLLPLSGLLWYTSHRKPIQRRYDVTLYKSLNIYLQDGVCSLHLLSMPLKAGTRSEFHASLQQNPTPGNRSLLLRSRKTGPYHRTWLVFPLWLTTGVLTLFCVLPVVQGPIRRRYRVRMGWCVYCGYNLTGNLSGRCSECGARVEKRRRRPSRTSRGRQPVRVRSSRN